jgi:hypothetical protein
MDVEKFAHWEKLKALALDGVSSKSARLLTNRNQNGKNGEPGGTRTRDHRIKSAMLYQLSYRPGGNVGIQPL